MLNRVRKFLKNNSPDWLNTEVNKNLLQNLTANIFSSQPNTSQTTHETQHINVLSSCSLSSQERVRERSHKTISPAPEKHPCTRATNTITSKLEFPTPGTPHWRRIKQVFQALDNAPQFASYNQLIEYVRETTGVGCSRKLISKWKKYRQNSSGLPPREDRDSIGNEQETNIVSTSPAMSFSAASPVPSTQTINDIPSTVNSFQLNEPADNFSNDDSLNCPSLLPVKTWSYLAAAGIMVSWVGCELIPLTSERLTENIAIASITTPITPLTPTPERRKNRAIPRNIKIELTLSNPQDLKVKPGEHISAGQALSDRASERNRLQAKKKQLQLSLEKLNLPLTPIPQPKPIPEISPLPPVSYAEEEAAIKLHKQKLKEAENAIALQQKKIDSLNQLNSSSQVPPVSRSSGDAEGRGIVGTGGGNLKLILSHEQANLKNLETAKQEAQIQLEVAQSKLTTAKEQRAYLEYQRQLEQTRRAVSASAEALRGRIRTTTSSNCKPRVRTYATASRKGI